MVERGRKRGSVAGADPASPGGFARFSGLGQLTTDVSGENYQTKALSWLRPRGHGSSSLLFRHQNFRLGAPVPAHLTQSTSSI